MVEQTDDYGDRNYWVSGFIGCNCLAGGTYTFHCLAHCNDLQQIVSIINRTSDFCGYYQEERYSTTKSLNERGDEVCFDWYQDYSTLRHHLAPYLLLAGQKLAQGDKNDSSNGDDKMRESYNSKDAEIFIPGCGNSGENCSCTV